MISATIEILRGDQALDISDLTNYAVLEMDGLGMAPLHRISERGPLQHGESDRGYRLDPRMIQMVLNLRSASWAGHYSQRQELLDWLSPTETISLRHSQPSGTVRQIDCYCVSGPEFATKDRSSFQFQKAAIRLVCPDPAWYDPARQSVRVNAGGGGTGFLFPGAVPWTFGGADIDADVVVEYAGTWLEYPEITIFGPIDDARIKNTETGNVLEFGGPTIEAGDYYVIDLRYGYKTVVDSTGANKIADLTAASDLATWCLQPGSNTINFSGENASDATAMVIRWYNRYIGV